MMLRCLTVGLSLALSVVAGTAWGQSAQSFPNKTVRSIVPNPPGGGTDIIARLMAERLTQLWGQTVVVENKPGAGGNIGGQAAARSKPDGYTIFSSHGGVSTVNEFLFKDMGFDSHTDLVPVTLVATSAFLIAVNPTVPANSLKELLDMLRKDPGKYRWASTYVGTLDHLGGELLQQMTNTKMTHVPYRGAPEGMLDVVAGRVPIDYVSVVTSMPQIQAGKMRPLAVTSKERHPSWPDVPTVAEQGVPGYEVLTWFGIWVPKGTPDDIRDKIAADVRKILEMPETKEKLAKDGFFPHPMTPAEFDAYVKGEREKYGKLITSLGLEKQ
jgi:tripartite-type tricarboxylate transporter receptor subunit TctC